MQKFLSLITDRALQVGAKRAKTCMQCLHVPTELPLCMPPLVVGELSLSERKEWGGFFSVEKDGKEEMDHHAGGLTNVFPERALQKKGGGELHMSVQTHLLCQTGSSFVPPPSPTKKGKKDYSK